jgi:prepilin-type N-terminal cleavage/methylation domain-containing protein
MRPAASERRGASWRRGFTFLELLLVLVLLSICAAMAYPRLSGSYGRMRYEKTKRAVEQLVQHAERQARLTGTRLLLSWDEEKRALLLTEADDVVPAAAMYAGAGPADEEPVSAKDFAAFAQDLQSRSGGNDAERAAAGLRDGTSRALGYSDRGRSGDRLFSSVIIAEDISLHAVGLPVRFDPAGASSDASLLLSRPGGATEEFVIRRAAAGSGWEKG